MSTLSEDELELRDQIYDRLICGANWEEVAEVLDGHMPYAVARLVAYVYCVQDLYGTPESDELIEESNKKVTEIIEEYIIDWKPAEREPTAGEIMDYEEKMRRYERGHR